MINIPGSNTTVIVDADALIGLIHDDDKLHDRCLKISKYLSSNSCGTVVPYPIVLEAATTLSRETSIARPDLAAKLLSDYSYIEGGPTFTYNVAALVTELYDPKTSKKNTPFDHYVLALAKKNDIKYVFSFDSFYKKNGLTLMEDVV